MDVLYIELVEADPNASTRWWICTDSELSASGTNTLADIESAVIEQVNLRDKYEVVVVLPDREVLFIEVEIPGRNQARVRQAAPFAVEPHLTEDIDDVHIALGDVKKNGTVPCLVINRVRFETYLSVIEDAGIHPNVITTPGMLVESSSDLYLIESDDCVTIRTADQLAVVASEALIMTLSSIVESEAGSTSVTCVGTTSLEVAVRQAINQLHDDAAEIELISFETLLTKVQSLSNMLNLQQGSYAVKDSRASIRLTLHKTALVAVACVLVVSAIAVIQGFWAGYQADRIREESLDIYESVYNTREVTGNPVFRMQERMGARIDERSKWLILLESVVGATAGVEIQNLDFNEAQNKMSITFFADSFQEFEAIRSRMEELGATVEVNVAEQQKDRVSSRITLATK